ncbi:IclR family transcriptional regulator [Patulibacter defluvii]|uniref:IclR family transcriptional regulator n=1 Tax=Patulibacter defluvii TaxID=3095358 RepID=UPI002A756FAA|nr:IclR family transcriptional regulator [Patulibacter sp. DM4]
MPSEKREGVQSLSRALDLLEALAASDERPLSELAEETGMIPSTAHRLLASLGQRGYVSQNPESGRYRIGFKLLELATAITSRRDRLRAAARPHLEALRDRTGESVNLVVLDRLDVVYLDQVEGNRSVRMFTQVGRTVPAHTTGAGKAILAGRPADEVARLYADDAVFAPLTARTITNAIDLDRALERVRRDGFAVDDEEHEEGVGCVASAIRDGDGQAIAAISVSGPSSRMITGSTAELGREVERHAAEVTAALAERAPATA